MQRKFKLLLMASGLVVGFVCWSYYNWLATVELRAWTEVAMLELENGVVAPSQARPLTKLPQLIEITSAREKEAFLGERTLSGVSLFEPKCSLAIREGLLSGQVTRSFSRRKNKDQVRVGQKHYGPYTNFAEKLGLRTARYSQVCEYYHCGPKGGDPWCGEFSDRLILDVVDALEKFKVPYFVTDGLLLTMLRDKTLRSPDGDADIIVQAARLTQLLAETSASNMKVGPPSSTFAKYLADRGYIFFLDRENHGRVCGAKGMTSVPARLKYAGRPDKYWEPPARVDFYGLGMNDDGQLKAPHLAWRFSYPCDTDLYPLARLTVQGRAFNVPYRYDKWMRNAYGKKWYSKSGSTEYKFPTKFLQPTSLPRGLHEDYN